VGTSSAPIALLPILFRDHFHAALDGQQPVSKSGGTSNFPPDDSAPAPLVLSLMNASETGASWPFGISIHPTSGLLSLTVWSANASGSNAFLPGVYPVAVRACTGSACSVADMSVAVFAATTCTLPSISIATVNPPSLLPPAASIVSWPGYLVSFDVTVTLPAASSPPRLLYSLHSSPISPLSPQNPVAVTPLSVDGSIRSDATAPRLSLHIQSMSQLPVACITDIALSYPPHSTFTSSLFYCPLPLHAIDTAFTAVTIIQPAPQWMAPLRRRR